MVNHSEHTSNENMRCPPTVATEAVFLTALRDAQEGHDVGICDVPGVFHAGRHG